MAIGQMVGARLGAGMVLKRGGAIVRPIVITVSLLMSARLLFWH
jgi:uncharacterized membrane protein YfcA